MGYRGLARRSARKYGLDPRIFERQIQQESGFNPNARSPAGARGIAQIMPGTAKAWGVNPDDPRAALDAAAKNMAGYVHKYGSYKNALVAYNAGPGRVGGSLPSETQHYIKAILGDSGEPARRAGEGMKTATTTKTSYDTTNLLNALVQGRSASSLAKEIIAAPKQVMSETHRIKTRSKDNTSAKGLATFEGVKVAAWMLPDLQYARRHGWKGKVNNGFRSYQEQARIYNSGVRPAARPGTSNHEGTEFPRGAVDADPSLRYFLPKGSKLRWAGAKDPVHYSYPHDGAY
jgi:hypothetical protein